jgi:hypothetical protein
VPSLRATGKGCYSRRVRGGIACLQRTDDERPRSGSPQAPKAGTVTISTLSPRRSTMNIHIALQPLIALIAGILILIMPRLLNYVVAIYLIIIGLIGLLPLLHLS